MRRHEQELISALAEGALENESEARALIASSPALMAEYEAQKAAVDAMRSVQAAQMSDSERASLRRDVWTELRNEAPEPAKGSLWFLKRPAMVTAAVLIVATFGVLSQLNSAGIDSMAAESASELESGDLAASPSADDAGGMLDAPTSSEEGAIRSADAVVYQDIADSIRAGAEKVAFLSTEVADGSTDTVQECIAGAGLEDQVILGEVNPTGYAVLVVSPIDTPGSTTPIHFVDAETCTLVYTAE